MGALKNLLRLAFVSCACVLLITPAFSQEEVFKQALKRAEQGDIDAQLSVGMMYDFGQGVPQNYAEAIRWYRRSADRGNPAAQNNLGVMHMNGQGVPANAVEAARWIRMAADQGYAQAQMNLGWMHAQGTGVPRNYSEAIRWSRLAAEQGDAEGQLNLGVIYAEGQVARADYVEAYKWLSLATAKGDSTAQEKRDQLAGRMSSQQIAEAQKLAASFAPKKNPNTANLPKSSGTGFFLSSDGYFLTANHVVEDASRIVVKTKYLAMAAQVVKVDKDNDLALLKIVGAFPPAVGTHRASYLNPETRLASVASRFRPLLIVDSDAMKLGESISTLGFPNLQLQGAEPKFTRGEINSLSGIKDDPHYFQISAPVQPGNSGGPLLDANGRVVGMIQMTLGDLNQLLRTGMVSQNVNYALKSAYLVSFLKAVPGLVLQDPLMESTTENKDWLTEAQTSIAVVLAF
jgi:TPR repeat protein